MRFERPPLTFEQQADLLISRGMLADRALLIERLRSVNYHRLSAYVYPFRQPDRRTAGQRLEVLIEGTEFSEIWHRYAFDRRLRLVVLDAVERIEIAVKTRLAYEHAHDFGPFGYSDRRDSLPKMTAKDHADFVGAVGREAARSREQFVYDYFKEHGDSHWYLPVWMMVEIVPFGTMLTMYKAATRRVKQSVATVFGVPETVFESWLQALNAVRNICAHHARLWNRELGEKPKVLDPAAYPDWHTPVVIPNNRMFMVLSICTHCIVRIAPQSGWTQRLGSLLNEHRGLVSEMGFPANWKDSGVWHNIPAHQQRPPNQPEAP